MGRSQRSSLTERGLCYGGFTMSVSEQEPRPRRSRREERKEETRAELIAAAAKVFARRGLDGASLEEIAREAGYSTGAIYWHFSDKDDLFLAVFEAWSAARARSIVAFSEHNEGELPQRARAFADQMMARLGRNPESMLLALEFLVHAWREPKLREAFGNRVAWGQLAATRLLEDEVRERGVELPMPAEKLAIVLRELGTGLALAKLADPDAIPDELYGDFVELFFTLAVESVPPRGAKARGPAKARKPRASKS